MRVIWIIVGNLFIFGLIFFLWQKGPLGIFGAGMVWGVLMGYLIGQASRK